MRDQTHGGAVGCRGLEVSFALLLVASGCALPASPTSHQGWLRTTPQQAGIDAERIDELVDQIRTGRVPALTSLLVVRRGRLAVEEYFNGYDGTELHTMQSVSKSFSSAILGIAIAEGVVGSPKDPVLDYFPDYRIQNLSAQKERLSIEDLLTMRSGTDYHERGSGSPHRELNRLATGWDRFYLDRPMIADPGSRFRYDSGAVILSSALINARAGVHADQYAKSRLFGELGIESHRWYRNSEGHPHMGGGLFLRPLDMARFGQLYLDRGRWRGEQIIPESWIEASLRRHVDLAGKSHRHVIGYGYWWWIFEPGGGATRPFYAAYGANGQFIFVVPEFDLVVVVTGRTTAYRDESAPMRFMYSHVLPAVAGTITQPGRQDPPE